MNEFYGLVPPEPLPETLTPGAEDRPTRITIDKTLFRVRVESETEEQLIIVIEPKK